MTKVSWLLSFFILSTFDFAQHKLRRRAISCYPIKGFQNCEIYVKKNLTCFSFFPSLFD